MYFICMALLPLLINASGNTRNFTMLVSTFVDGKYKGQDRHVLGKDMSDSLAASGAKEYDVVFRNVEHSAEPTAWENVLGESIKNRGAVVVETTARCKGCDTNDYGSWVEQNYIMEPTHVVFADLVIKAKAKGIIMKRCFGANIGGHQCGMLGKKINAFEDLQKLTSIWALNTSYEHPRNNKRLTLNQKDATSVINIVDTPKSRMSNYEALGQYNFWVEHMDDVGDQDSVYYGETPNLLIAIFKYGKVYWGLGTDNKHMRPQQKYCEKVGLSSKFKPDEFNENNYIVKTEGPDMDSFSLLEFHPQADAGRLKVKGQPDMVYCQNPTGMMVLLSDPKNKLEMGFRKQIFMKKNTGLMHDRVGSFATWEFHSDPGTPKKKWVLSE